MAAKGETLNEFELGRLKPIRGEGGKTWRAFCPFHGSDKQRSLRVDRISGRFQCFACEAWGYMDWAREEFRNAKGQDKAALEKVKPGSANRLLGPLPLSRAISPAASSAVPDSQFLREQLAAYQAALPGSLGEEYLSDRKISLTLAQKMGLGYSAPGSWAHRGESGRPIRDWNFGRLVFPHTGPAGQVVNLYGRAIGDQVPKSLRHDHLPGNKGYFNFPALERAAATSEDLYICEGPFDALSILAVRPEANAVAIFGVQGWRHDWAAGVKRVVFALDADAAGQNAWRSLARQLTLRGKQVSILPPAAYGGAKDANDAWTLGMLDLG
jgi:DNA primase